MRTVQLKRLALFVGVAAIAAIAYTQGYHDNAEDRGFTLLPEAQAGGHEGTHRPDAEHAHQPNGSLAACALKRVDEAGFPAPDIGRIGHSKKMRI